MKNDNFDQVKFDQVIISRFQVDKIQERKSSILENKSYHTSVGENVLFIKICFHK